MKQIHKFFLIMIPLLMLLTACSGSIEEEQEKAIERTKEAFQSEMKANNELNDYNIYLPSGMKVETEDENNILLSSGSTQYILFINPIEGENSTVTYESTLLTSDNFRVNEKFEDENRFGYLLISDVDEELYEVTVGIGGIKMTTAASVNDLAHEAKLMMQIISSIELKE